MVGAVEEVVAVAALVAAAATVGVLAEAMEIALHVSCVA
jgi:hypothetical protein